MTWLRDHPGRAVSEADIAELVGKAYGKAANYDNAVGAFSRTGINPFNPHVFGDEDYIAADVSDIPQNQQIPNANTLNIDIVPVPESEVVITDGVTGSSTELVVTTTTDSAFVSAPEPHVVTADDVTGSVIELVVTVSTASTSITAPEPNVVIADGVTGSSTELVVTTATDSASVSAPEPDVVTTDNVTGSATATELVATVSTASASINAPEPNVVIADGVTGSSTELVVTTASTGAVYTATSNFSSLIPIPKLTTAGRSQKRKVRKSSLAVIITSSPYEQQLTKVQQEKEAEMLAKNERKRKRENQTARSEGGKGKLKKVCKTASGSRNKKRQTSPVSEDEDEPLSSFVHRVKCRPKQNSSWKRSKIDKKDHSQCKVCHFTYNDPKDPQRSDDWVQCAKCKAWLHETCAQNSGVFDEDDGYLCKDCL